MIIEALQRYWKKVDRRGDDDCWLWQGSRTQTGYGQISSGKTRYNRYERVLATHVALAIDGRPRPNPEMVAMHGCDTPRCVNPKHLKWGTSAENMQDMWRKERSGWQQRAATAMDANAANLPQLRRGITKLNEEAVRYIRESDKTTLALAEEFGVTNQCISNVRTRRTWANVA